MVSEKPVYQEKRRKIMSILEVSTMAVLLLLLFLSCQTVNSGGHVITEGLAPMHGSYKMLMKKAPRTQLGMAYAASDLKHVLKSEAGQDKAIGEYKDTTEIAASTFDEAKTAYKDAKKRVGEAYQTAEDTMTESAKEKYEDAKEKSSKAAGDLGAKMEGKEEL